MRRVNLHGPFQMAIRIGVRNVWDEGGRSLERVHEDLPGAGFKGGL
jgi:hypothetical protein